MSPNALLVAVAAALLTGCGSPLTPPPMADSLETNAATPSAGPGNPAAGTPPTGPGPHGNDTATEPVQVVGFRGSTAGVGTSAVGHCADSGQPAWTEVLEGANARVEFVFQPAGNPAGPYGLEFSVRDNRTRAYVVPAKAAQGPHVAIDVQAADLRGVVDIRLNGWVCDGFSLDQPFEGKVSWFQRSIPTDYTAYPATGQRAHSSAADARSISSSLPAGWTKVTPTDI